jgi:hypothetical protein
MPPLLKPGNEKLGPDIWSWSIPCVVSCPGASDICKQLCYVERYCRRRPRIRQLYTDNYEYCQQDPNQFRRRMIDECQTKRVVRVHVAGDFYDEDYILCWRTIAERCPRTLFYSYTRSWRLPELMNQLEQLANRPNWKMIYSCDRETGVPDGPVECAYLMHGDGDLPPVPVRLAFRNYRRTVMHRARGAIVCPKETGVRNDAARALTCTTCRLCFRDKLCP